MNNIKKIELHIHLDGSMSLQMAANISGYTIDEVKKKMIANDKCKDLEEYLEKFDFPISLMQSEDNLKKVAKDLVDQLENENVIYSEIRFCPLFHTKKGLTPIQVIDNVILGLRENQNVKTNLILCMMREMTYEDNKRIIDLAKMYLGKGVVGIDLAGDEKKYPLKDYKKLFLLAKKMNIPFTIHAGEVCERDLLDAIKLGAKRIGHGVKCINDDSLIQLIKEKNILLEICPTSNIETNAFETFKDHPVYDLYKKNINMLINTDNMTVSNTNLNLEYEKLLKNFNFKLSDFDNMNRNSINYTFLSSKEKIELLDIMRG